SLRVAWSVFVPNDAVGVSDVEISLMERQAEGLDHFRRVEIRCWTASATSWRAAALASAATAPRSPLGWGRTLRIGESFVRYAILIGITQNHDCILRWFRYEDVAVRRKLHQSRARNIVSM